MGNVTHSFTGAINECWGCSGHRTLTQHMKNYQQPPLWDTRTNYSRIKYSTNCLDSNSSTEWHMVLIRVLGSVIVFRVKFMRPQLRQLKRNQSNELNETRKLTGLLLHAIKLIMARPWAFKKWLFSQFISKLHGLDVLSLRNIARINELKMERNWSNTTPLAFLLRVSSMTHIFFL